MLKTKTDHQNTKSVDSSAPPSSPLKLLWFSAQWCGPCKQMAPTYRAIQERYGKLIDIEKIDVDQRPELATDYQIRGVPSLIMTSSDGVIARQVGALPLKELSVWVERNINTQNRTSHNVT